MDSNPNHKVSQESKGKTLWKWSFFHLICFGDFSVLFLCLILDCKLFVIETVFIAYILYSVGKVSWTHLYHKYLPAVRGPYRQLSAPLAQITVQLSSLAESWCWKSRPKFFCLTKANLWSVELVNLFLFENWGFCLIQILIIHVAFTLTRGHLKLLAYYILPVILL